MTMVTEEEGSIVSDGDRGLWVYSGAIYNEAGGFRKKCVMKHQCRIALFLIHDQCSLSSE